MSQPDPSWHGNWTAPALAGGAATLLYLSGLFSFLFAVPVQLAYERSGKTAAVYGTGIALVLVAISRAIQTARLTVLGGQAWSLVAMDVMIPAGIMGGLLAFNLARRVQWSIRLLLAGAIGVVGAVPLIATFAANTEVNRMLEQQLMPMLESMGITVEAGFLIEQVRRIILSTIGLAMVSSIAANWWIGTQLGFRRVLRLRKAVVEDTLVWLVIGGLALIVLAWIGDGDDARAIRVAGFVGWNAAAVGAFLFSVQGVGVIEHLVERRGTSRRALRWILLLIVFALFMPGINVVIMVGVPAIGISEIWIDYKRRRVNEGHT